MDLDTLLQDTASVPDPTPRALTAGRLALDTAATSGRRQVAAIGRAHNRRRRRVLLTGLVASAASVVLVIGPTIGLGGSHPVARAGAAQVLRQAGAAAGAQPGGWPDAAYWHSVSSHYQGSGPTFRREIWIGHHAIGVLKDEGVEPGVVPLDVASFPAGQRGLTWDQLYALPTQTAALERELRSGISTNDGKARSADAELFVIVGDLLRESPASPALRKALWEVAAQIPGVTLVGSVTDSAGRPGVAVERDQQRYVLDPDDGRLLEESHDSWHSTYLEQGPSDTAPAVTNPMNSKG